MSIRCIEWAFRVKGLKPSAKLVLIKLADNANDQGEAYPALGTIAEHTGISRRTVIRQIRELEAAGLVDVERRKVGDVNLPNVYRLNLSGVVTEDHQGGDTTSLGVVTPCHQGGDTVTPGVVTQCHPNRQGEPSLNRQNEPSLNRGAPAQPTPTAQIWRAYRDAYRERYGVEPVSNAKVMGQLKRLHERLGEDAAAVAAWYPSHQGALYVRSRHHVDLLLRDAEALHTDWRRGRVVTEAEARQADATAGRGNVWNGIIHEFEDRESAGGDS